MTPLRVLLPLAVAAGIGGGALAAAVLPGEPEAAGTTAPAGPAASTTAPRAGLGAGAGARGAAPVRIAPARPPRRPDVELRLRPGTLAIDGRTPDPDGGPAWAVRVFDADRIVAPASRRRGVDPTIGSARCAQLGRIVRGRFGWLDHEGTWRPVAVGYEGAPMTCGSIASRRAQVAADAVTTLRLPAAAPADAQLVRMAVWGVAPEGTELRLTTRGRAAGPAGGPRGGFLALLDPATRRKELRLDAVRRGRALPVTGLAARGGGPGGGDGARLVARAPDPAGGLPYALLVSRGARGLCTASGPRVVAGRTGGVDLVLGTFTEQAYGGGGCGMRPPTRARPLDVGYSLGGGVEEPHEEGERRGRVERRILPGRTIVSGIAHPAVRSVTIATPRDVRTLVPSGRERGFIAVYDGGFPTGEIVLTARLDDGTTRQERFQDAGL